MSPSHLPIWQVDAFADRAFAGNPAAICILHKFASDQWMQCVAAEMNLAETAFVVPTEEASLYHLRWFTPSTEVDLCGHATLAAAHVLWELKRVQHSVPIRFQTKSGQLVCYSTGLGIKLDFPASPVEPLKSAAVKLELLEALRIPQAEFFQTSFDIMVCVDSPDVVRDLNPDYRQLASVETRGVMVTSTADVEGVDFISRFFAPRCGIAEDPVTGSAHCCLAPYWAGRMGRTTLVGYQASPRGGIVRCEVVHDRVHLTGNAITILEGFLKCEPD